MATQMVPFDQAPVPAHIKKFVDAHSNIDARSTVNQLSFRGKVWRQVINGEERPLLNKEEEPVSTVQVVVLNYNKARSRAYYEGAFEEGKSQPPACWSSDGITPDATVKEKQSPTCGTCKNAIKGSKITPQGKEVTACSVYKRLAVVPLANLQCPPLLLRLAQTSTWDKNNTENESKGYYAWDQYTDMLRARGASHTGVVATKIRFDSRTAYPKLVFAASRWLTDDEMEEVSPLFDSEPVLTLLNASEAAAAARKLAAPVAPVAQDDDDTEVPPAKDDDEEEEAPKPVKGKAKVKAQTPAPDEDEEEKDDDEEEAPAPKADMAAVKARVPARVTAAAPAPKKNGKAADLKVVKAAPPEVEEGEEAEVPKVAVVKGKGKGNGLADLVEEWDD